MRGVAQKCISAVSCTLILLLMAVFVVAIIADEILTNAMKKQKENAKTSPQGLCGECRHVTKKYCPDVKGVNFLGRCPYKEFAVFLRHDTCPRFQKDIPCVNNE